MKVSHRILIIGLMSLGVIQVGSYSYTMDATSAHTRTAENKDTTDRMKIFYENLNYIFGNRKSYALLEQYISTSKKLVFQGMENPSNAENRKKLIESLRKTTNEIMLNMQTYTYLPNIDILRKAVQDIFTSQSNYFNEQTESSLEQLNTAIEEFNEQATLSLQQFISLCESEKDSQPNEDEKEEEEEEEDNQPENDLKDQIFLEKLLAKIQRERAGADSDKALEEKINTVNKAHQEIENKINDLLNPMSAAKLDEYKNICLAIINKDSSLEDNELFKNVFELFNDNEITGLYAIDNFMNPTNSFATPIQLFKPFNLARICKMAVLSSEDTNEQIAFLENLFTNAISYIKKSKLISCADTSPQEKKQLKETITLDQKNLENIFHEFSSRLEALKTGDLASKKKMLDKTIEAVTMSQEFVDDFIHFFTQAKILIQITNHQTDLLPSIEKCLRVLKSNPLARITDIILEQIDMTFHLENFTHLVWTTEESQAAFQRFLSIGEVQARVKAKQYFINLKSEIEREGNHPTKKNSISFLEKDFINKFHDLRKKHRSCKKMQEFKSTHETFIQTFQNTKFKTITERYAFFVREIKNLRDLINLELEQHEKNTLTGCQRQEMAGQQQERALQQRKREEIARQQQEKFAQEKIANKFNCLCGNRVSSNSFPSHMFAQIHINGMTKIHTPVQSQIESLKKSSADLVLKAQSYLMSIQANEVASQKIQAQIKNITNVKATLESIEQDFTSIVKMPKSSCDYKTYCEKISQLREKEKTTLPKITAYLQQITGYLQQEELRFKQSNLSSTIQPINSSVDNTSSSVVAKAQVAPVKKHHYDDEDDLDDLEIVVRSFPRNTSNVSATNHATNPVGNAIIDTPAIRAEEPTSLIKEKIAKLLSDSNDYKDRTNDLLSKIKPYEKLVELSEENKKKVNDMILNLNNVISMLAIKKAISEQPSQLNKWVADAENLHAHINHMLREASSLIDAIKSVPQPTGTKRPYDDNADEEDNNEPSETIKRSSNPSSAVPAGNSERKLTLAEHFALQNEVSPQLLSDKPEKLDR